MPKPELSNLTQEEKQSLLELADYLNDYGETFGVNDFATFEKFFHASDAVINAVNGNPSPEAENDLTKFTSFFNGGDGFEANYNKFADFVAKKKGKSREELDSKMRLFSKSFELGLEEKLVPEPVPEPKPVDTADENGLTFEEYYRQNANQGYNTRLKDKDAQALAKDQYAKALASALNIGSGKQFNLDEVNRAAEEIKKTKAFQALTRAKTREGTIKWLAEYSNRNTRLMSEDAFSMVRPYYASHEKQIQVLTNLKEMAAQMDPPTGRSTKWKNLVNSLNSIDLNDKNLNPEKKLEEIARLNEEYQKGKKSERFSEDGQNRFDQSLCITKELGNVSAGAKMCADGIFARTNEVREKKDQLLVREDDYGVDKINFYSNKKEPEKTVDDPRKDSLGID